MALLRIDTSGWSYNHWQGLFYPQDLPPRERYSYYKERFNTVEINNTFYRLPAEKTFLNWRQQAPEGFIYAVKASRYITHLKRLRDPEQPLEKLMSRVRLLGETLGPILYQLPPRWRPDLDRLKGFIEALPQDPVQIFQFRDPRRLCQPVFDLLEENALGFCIMSLPHLACPKRVTAQTVYIRLHGSRSLYASRHPSSQLEEWARHIAPLLSEGHDVYVYFNNDAFAYAGENARELHHLVEEMVPLEEKA